MSDQIVMFYECGSVELTENAKRVLAGEKTISVLIPSNTREYFISDVTTVTKATLDEKWKLSLYDEFKSNMCVQRNKNVERSTKRIKRRDGSYKLEIPSNYYVASPRRSRRDRREALYKPSLVRWLTEQGRKLSAGLWDVADPMSIASEIIDYPYPRPLENALHHIMHKGKELPIAELTPYLDDDGNVFYNLFFNVKLANVFRPILIASKPKRAKRTKSDAIHQLGADARAAKYRKLEDKAIELYQSGKFKSRKQASRELLPLVNDFARENGLTPLTESNGAATIYKYLLKI